LSNGKRNDLQFDLEEPVQNPSIKQETHYEHCTEKPVKANSVCRAVWSGSFGFAATPSASEFLGEVVSTYFCEPFPSRIQGSAKHA
jgi:hypothetical protein